MSLSGENQVLHMPAGPQPVTRTRGTTTTANSVNILRLWCPPDIDGCELQFAAINIREVIEYVKLLCHITVLYTALHTCLLSTITICTDP